MRNYVRFRTDITNSQDMSDEEKEKLDSYYYPANIKKTSFWYYYKINIGGKNILLVLCINSDASISTLQLNLAITGNTTISLSFPS